MLPILFTYWAFDMNVDEQEVEKFNQMAARWWDPSGDCKPLHDLNPLRMQFIEQHLDVFDQKICDVGCGGGILSEALQKRGAKVTGIDMSENLIKVANLHQKTSGLDIHYIHTTIEAFSEKHPSSFDAITCMELLEHVPDPKAFIESCVKILKPGGKFFLSTLNRTLKCYLQAIVGAEYILKILPKGTHDYKKFIKPSELDARLAEADIKTLGLQGMTYHPFSKSFSLSKDVSVNYLLAGEKSHD